MLRSFEVFVWALCMSTLLQCSQAVSGICPMGCFCSEKVVDCSALMEFPTDLPSDTTVFKVSHLNVYEIPAYAFSYLENITTIEFVNCNIANIVAFAFSSLPSIKQLVFDKTVIRNLESYSFMNLDNVTRIQFSKSRIDCIKDFTFYKLSNVVEFNFVSTHIRYFYNHGFYDCSNFDTLQIQGSNISDFSTGAFEKVVNITQFKVEGTSFWNMHCGVIDDMQSTTENFYVTDNTFYCNCSISWMFSDEGSSRYAYLKGKSSCHGPDKMKPIAALGDVDFTELGCKGRTPATKVPCKREILKPKPRSKGGVVRDGVDIDEGPGGGTNSVQIGILHVICILGLVNSI